MKPQLTDEQQKVLEKNPVRKFDDAAMQDIWDNPEKYGAPTFEEFCRKRESFLDNHRNPLLTAEKGTSFLKKIIRKTRFEIFGFRCKNLEEVEKIAWDHGYNPLELELKPELLPLNSHECDVLVKFVPLKTVPTKT